MTGPDLAATPGAPSPPRPAAVEEPAEALGRAETAARAGRFGEAAGICEDVLGRTPDQPAAKALLGTIHGHRGDFEGGIRLLEAACAARPDVAAWHGNLCGLYRMTCRFDDALAAARRAVAIGSDPRSALLNLAKVHMDRGEQDEAIAGYLATLARDNTDPEAHLGLGQVLLSRGDFRPGWVEYEWRNRTEQARGTLPGMGAPMWNGMRLPSGRLLLIGDQGFGDTLQFCRYIPMVAERAADVHFACSAELAPLMEGIPGIGGMSTRWPDVPGHAAYCLLSSLPMVFGTEYDTIPRGVPYLRADPDLIARWRERLAGLLPGGTGPKVGLVWAGRPSHPNDRRRSMSLDDLRPILDVPGVRFVSLQKPVPARDAARLGSVPSLGDALETFADTAAVLMELDLLITVDSAVAHLAGALGRPVWMLTATPSDWRWMVGRTDTPWYPSLRIFRQQAPGNWRDPVGAAAAALAA